MQIESFPDKLGRLYISDKKYEMNGGHVITLTFQVTEDCNLCCSYCYQHNKSHHRMNFETAKKAIDLILHVDDKVNSYVTSTRNVGVVLDFIGGEPLLEVELIDEIIDYFVKQCILLKHPWATKYIVVISSNGTLYFDERVQRFLRKHYGHLSFNISLDGNKELHDSCRTFPNGKGSYDIAEAAVLDYKNTFGFLPGSKMTFSKANIMYTFDAIKNMIDLGYTSIHANCTYEDEWDINDAKIFYSELKKISDFIIDNRMFDKISCSLFTEEIGVPIEKDNDNNYCGGTGLMLGIDWKGNFYPCLRYMESSLGENQEPFVIGDVNNGINVLDEHKKRINCLSCITRTSQSTKECVECKIAKGCGWCSAYNYEVNGTPNKRITNICIMHKARVLANVYYWGKIYKTINSLDSIKLNMSKEECLEIIDENEYTTLLNYTKR